MAIAFLIIILMLAMFYALWTKQFKTALGLLVLALAFLLQIPDLVSVFWSNFLLASSLIIFAFGIFIIIWRKKEPVPKADEVTPKGES